MGFLLTGVGGTLMVVYAARNLWREHIRLASNGTSSVGPEVRETKKLKDISHIWEGEKIKLRDIAHIWREIEIEKPEKNRPKPVFSHKEIKEFYKKYVDTPVVKGNRRIVIEKLLKMLDDGGDCPSIVGRGRYENDKEPERGYALERYACCARIPLWKHSIDVAERYISKFQYKVMIPNALVIALGHDIGMVEEHYAKNYSKLTHPEISLLILKSIPEYMCLDNFEEINSIIRDHHSITNQQIVKVLKAADQEVRTIEFTRAASDDAREQSAEVLTQGKAEPTEDKEQSVLSNYEEVFPVFEAEVPGDLHSDGIPHSEANLLKYVPMEIAPLPLWIDFEAILSYIGKQINMIEKTSDMSLNWTAYSVREGYVWVKENLLLEAVMKTSKENASFFASEVDKAARWNVLYTVVMELGRRGAVVSEMVKEGKYLAQVTILTGKGKALPAYMTPFHSGAFGILPDELEQRKGSVLNKVVKNIVPIKQEIQS
jgi:hypothetical protein